SRAQALRSCGHRACAGCGRRRCMARGRGTIETVSPARKVADVEEPDRVEGQPHPREVYDLIGQDDALARAARSVRSGRPPHGLMLAGPAGIGKATLAYRIARYVLRYGASADGPAEVSVPKNDGV